MTPTYIYANIRHTLLAYIRTCGLTVYDKLTSDNIHTYVTVTHLPTMKITVTSHP